VDEGLRAASTLRARHPRLAIVILSEHLEAGPATRALAESPERLGYLLKERVTDPADFVGTLQHVMRGGSALDPQVVSRLLAASDDGPLAALTAREREVLQLVAEGRSNQAIADRLVITLRSTEKYVSAIFSKLGLPATGTEHRRVLAVLQFLQA
jgi:DNA-binding NarL/FixJ family response regulator